MTEKNKHYFKVLNHEMFGGDGSEGLIKLSYSGERIEPKEILYSIHPEKVKYIEITKEEYLSSEFKG